MKFTFAALLIISIVCFNVVVSLQLPEKKALYKRRKDDGDAGADAGGDSNGSDAPSGNDNQSGANDQANDQAQNDLDVPSEDVQEEDIESIPDCEPIFYSVGDDPINMIAALNFAVGFELSNVNALQQYLPYFLLSGLVQVDLAPLYQHRYWGLQVIDGPVANCLAYKENNDSECEVCQFSFYLHQNTCVDTCPHGFHADNIELKCAAGSGLLGVKAFSLGSCLNSCGQSNNGCDCHPEAARSGTLCSDYYNSDYGCEASWLHTLNNDLQTATCDLKNDIGGNDVCVQCAPGHLLIVDNADSPTQNNPVIIPLPVPTPQDIPCVPVADGCPDTHRKLHGKNICVLLTPNCNVENCEECLGGNDDKCIRCDLGFFLLNGQCVQRCEGRVADKVTGTCIPRDTCENEQVIYWDSNSDNTCGKGSKVTGPHGDCNCPSEKCYETATCCSDVRNVCPFTNSFKRKANKTVVKGDFIPKALIKKVRINLRTLKLKLKQHRKSKK